MIVQASCPLERVFHQPSPAFAPTPIWWWSGEALRSDRLCWQLQQLAGGGIRDVVILNLAPLAPLHGKDADQPAFFSEAWWDIFLQVCGEAKRLGMGVYFYDQIGFSGANIQGSIAHRDARLRGQRLNRKVHLLRAGEELRWSDPDRLLAAYFQPIQRDGVFERIDAGGGFTATQSGRLDVVVWQQYGYDYFHPHAGPALLDAIHRQFEQRAGDLLGTVIRGSIQDELPAMPTWGAGFVDAFFERCGYDPTDRLWALWEGDDASASQMRRDYHRVRASLAEEGFFKPLFNWHREHGMICGFDQQTPARAGELYGGVHIYGDYLGTHRWFDAPGSDLHGEVHVHRSLADAYRRPRTLIEGFHSTGWGGTLEETFDWLLPWLRGGANFYVPHAVYYGTRGGWWEWAAPSTGFRQPYWRHYHSFAQTVTRCCEAITLGDHMCELAIYYPTAAAQSGARLDAPTPGLSATQSIVDELVGRAYWTDPQPGLLDRLGRDYNFVDDHMLASATVDKGCLCVAGLRFDAVIVPAVEYLPAEVESLLKVFANVGGNLVCHAPTAASREVKRAEGFTRLAAERVKGRTCLVEDVTALAERLAETPPLLEGDMPTHVRRVDGWHVALVPATAGRATRTRKPDNWLDIEYTFDRERYQQSAGFLIRGRDLEVQAWSPVSGKRHPVSAAESDEGVRIELRFDDGPLLWLAWRERDTGSPGAETGDPQPVIAFDPAECQETIISDRNDAWQASLVDTVDNRWGDVAWPASQRLSTQTWFFEHVSDDAEDPSRVAWDRAEASRATYGCFGWTRITDGTEPLALSGPDVAPAGDGWCPVMYSLSRGIGRDDRDLGPSGHVAEDFLDLGRVEPGQAAHFRTWFHSECERRVWLMVGAAAGKEIALNGERLEPFTGYFCQRRVTLRPGLNRLDFRLAPARAGQLRALWCLLDRQPMRPRPERITWPGDPQNGQTYRFTRRLVLDAPSTGGVVQIGSIGPTVFRVDGQEIGRHGGFTPYDGAYSIFRYPLPPLAAGEHTFEVHASAVGTTPTLMIDGQIESSDGGQHVVVGDDRWTVSVPGSEDQPVAFAAQGSVALALQSAHDPAFELLHRRPHPLPRTRWRDAPPDADAVLDVVPIAYPGENVTQWFRWLTPPGARSMALPVTGEAAVWIDGKPAAIRAGRVEWSKEPGPPRRVEMRVRRARHLRGGAVFQGPAEYELGPGVLQTGDWADQGLASWSGGVRYERTFMLDSPASGPAFIDLGGVRGTAEVELNGVDLGARFCGPWRYDATGQLTAGSNKIVVKVFNTLGPWLHASSPTTFVHRGQTVSGLLGPVTLWTQRS